MGDEIKKKKKNLRFKFLRIRFIVHTMRLQTAADKTMKKKNRKEEIIYLFFFLPQKALKENLIEFFLADKLFSRIEF